MKRAWMALVVFALSAVPAKAASFTIDSTNCNSISGDCYGLSWTLNINDLTGGNYQAILTVADDTLVAGTPNLTISAVDFKVSNSVTSGSLYLAPTALGGWTTAINVLNSGGCTGPNSGFVCSQSATAPGTFTGSALTWGWYFSTADPIFTDLVDGHIGAKMTTLSQSGKLLSASYTAVPEPQSVAILGIGALMFLVSRRRYLGLS